MRLSFTLSLVLTMVPFAVSADPPAMFRGNAAHTGVYPAPGLRRLTLDWRVCTGGKVRSTPVVAAGAVLFGSEDGTLYAVDAADGTIRWTAALGGPVTSSPAVAGTTVLVVAADGRLQALDLASGKLLWATATGPQVPYAQHENDPRSWDFYASSPVVAGDTVIYGGADGAVHAVDLADGRQRWSFATDDAVRATPAVADGLVAAGGMDGVLYALDADTGALRWTFDTDGNSYFPRGEVQSSPAIAGGAVVFGARDGFLYALDADTGEERWRSDHQGSWVITSPAVADGLVVAGSSDGEFVQAVDLDTGAERWRYDTGARVFSSPAVAGGLAYVGTWDGTLLGIDLRSGAVKARTLAESAIMSSPVVAGGRLYVGADDSCLYAFGGTPYDPASEPEPITLTPDQAAVLAGRYELPSGGTIVVTADAGAVSLTLGGQEFALLAVTPTELMFRDADVRVRFVVDNGAATAMDLIQGDTAKRAKRLP